MGVRPSSDVAVQRFKQCGQDQLLTKAFTANSSPMPALLGDLRQKLLNDCHCTACSPDGSGPKTAEFQTRQGDKFNLTFKPEERKWLIQYQPAVTICIRHEGGGKVSRIPDLTVPTTYALDIRDRELVPVLKGRMHSYQEGLNRDKKELSGKHKSKK